MEKQQTKELDVAISIIKNGGYIINNIQPPKTTAV